jgi:predicted AAA+ superfamily ATPase
MEITKADLIPILAQFNPWWRNESISDLPTWKRAAFNELLNWVVNPPALRAVMLSGARQVGKTTLILQIIDQLIKDGVNPKNIIYVTFDHPILKLAGLQSVLEAWRELEPKGEGLEYLFLDEAQVVRDFGTWVKHQVDFFKQRRIVFTGSAMSLASTSQESGVGRWYTMRISTLSFYEYLQIKRIKLPLIPTINSLLDLCKYTTADFFRISEASQHLIGHFHEYLVRGGFPQTALVDSISQAQRLLREDIIDKVLKRDMTALFGVRRIIELEQTFIYLCMHDGGIQDINSLASNLGVTRPTVLNFINLLESTHLLFRLPPFGLGKEILRARYKLYMVDPAIAPAILMKGKTILEDSKLLGQSVETSVCGHLSAHSGINHTKFSYWKDSNEKEVDLVLETPHSLIPFEVKYMSRQTDIRDIQGLVQFSRQKSIETCFVLTKEPQDIGPIQDKNHMLSCQFIRIPTSIFCYWLGESEISQKNIFF